MRFTVDDEGGQPIEFECPDTLGSRWTCGAILQGKTYPYLPFVDDVGTVLDVGANCGATTVHLARHYPEATIHAFEPGHQALSYLRRNVASMTNVVVHPFGLHSMDQELLLYVDDQDIGQASVVHPNADGRHTEIVSLRAAATWASEHNVDRIDVLKVDVEGCEIDVLESLAPLLPSVKVIYVEYESRGARRDLARLLDATHELYVAMLMALDQGECLYLRKDLADHAGATERLREIFTLSLSS